MGQEAVAKEKVNFKAGDVVVFYRSAYDPRLNSDREKWLSKILTINEFDGRHAGENKECYTVKDKGFLWIVREDEIRLATKLELALA